MKCIACGSVSLVEGSIVSTGDATASSFKLNDISTWKSLIGKGNRQIKAYGCVNCNHLQLAVDFSIEDRERYLKFEGVQPSVLERLNSEEE